MQRKADGAHAHERIEFMRHVNLGEKFVPANVQCAEDDRQGMHGLRRGLIGFKLLFLSEQLAAVEKQKLSPE